MKEPAWEHKNMLHKEIVVSYVDTRRGMGAKDERLAGKVSFPFRPGTMASRKKTLVISDGPYSEIEKQTS